MLHDRVFGHVLHQIRLLERGGNVERNPASLYVHVKKKPCPLYRAAYRSTLESELQLHTAIAVLKTQCNQS